MKKLFFLLFITTTSVAIAQENLAIGEWQTYPPLISNYVAVAQSSETVYFATKQSILTVDKDDNSFGYITRVSGLNDTHISRLSYNEATKTLLVYYENGNLDLVASDGKITNITDIKRASIVGTRTVYNIFNKGTEAWLACSFGLVRLDIPNQQVISTTFTPTTQTRGFTILNDTLWLATRNGIYWAKPTINLLDFGAWQRLPIRTNYSCKQLTSFNGKLVASINDSIFIRQTSGWNFLHTVADIDEYRSLEASSDHILTMASRGSDRCIVNYIYADGRVETPFLLNNVGDCSQVIVDNKKTWIADIWYGASMHDIPTSAVKEFKPSSPYQIECRQTAISPVDKSLWSATGSVSDNWTYQYNGAGFYQYKEGTWTNYNAFTLPNIFPRPSKLLLDVLTVAIRPSDGHVFFGSYSSENRPYMAECDSDGKNIKLYDANSSTSIQAMAADPNSRRISSMTFDKDNNLWICNYGALRPLSVMRTNGTWQNFDVPTNRLAQIIIDNNGYKWIVSEGGDGIIVFDEGDPAKNGDERSILLNTSNTALKTSNIYSLAVDLDGDIWVGTDKGAYVFQCSSSIFDSQNPCKGTQPLVSLDGIYETLLVQNTVTAIGVDGANRKWFGTNNGIFVQSADGRTPIAKFDKLNSPLPSNTIQYFTFNSKNGIVWISTTEGLISYRTNATLAENVLIEKPLVFPNPVRPEYNGPIAIRGLGRDANVKITDISGLLMYETTANGGQAVWDGRDYNGKRASSGVYLIYSTNSLGEQNVITKFMILN